MKLSFASEDKDLVVNVDPELVSGPCKGVYYVFRRAKDCGLDARLLADKLNEELQGTTSGLVRKAYEEGYKDGRTKKRKAKYFARVLHSLPTRNRATY